MKKKQLETLLYSVVGVIAMGLIIVAANVIFGVAKQRVDLTHEKLYTLPDHTRVTIGGVVTHRQRPATARGVTFLNLEDETGLTNVIVDEVVWDRHRRIARESGGSPS